MKKLKNKESYSMPVGVCLVGAYDLDLYCANASHSYHEGQASFGGETRRDCVRQAKAASWLISERKGVAVCPTCAQEQNY